MPIIVGAVSFMVAAAAAMAAALKFPKRQVLFERCAGGFMLGGLALLGLAVPML